MSCERRARVGDVVSSSSPLSHDKQKIVLSDRRAWVVKRRMIVDRIDDGAITNFHRLPRPLRHRSLLVLHLWRGAPVVILITQKPSTALCSPLFRSLSLSRAVMEIKVNFYFSIITQSCLLRPNPSAGWFIRKIGSRASSLFSAVVNILSISLRILSLP